LQHPLESDGLGTGHTDGPMVQWSHSFWVVQWPKSHNRPITQGSKKIPCSYCWPLFCNVCGCVCVCMRFSPLAEKLCSTNHKPLFSGPNRIHPIHIITEVVRWKRNDVREKEAAYRKKEKLWKRRRKRVPKKKGPGIERSKK